MSDSSVVQAFFNQIVGAWTFTLVSTGDPTGTERTISTGAERVWRIGDNWVVAELHGVDTDGGELHSVTTLGFDLSKQRIRGVVAGTMAPVLFELDGAVSQSGTELLVETEGPAITPGRDLDRYRDVYRVIDGGRRELLAQVRKDDGSWQTFMTTRYERSA